MKKTTTIMVALLTIVSLNAELPNSLPQLSSRAALRSYAIEQARMSYVWIWNQSMVSNPAPYVPIMWKDIISSTDIIKNINGYVEGLQVYVANPLDYLSVSVGIYNETEDCLFFGGTSVLPVYGKGGYSLPTVSFTYNMNWTIPIRMDRVASAKLLVSKSNGTNVQTQESRGLQVRDGKVYFETDYAGGGYLEITTVDGQTASYNLMTTNGTLESLKVLNLAGTMDTSFQGIYPFTNPYIIDWTVYSRNGIGENPLFEVKLASWKAVSVRVKTTEGVRPIGFNVRMRGSSVEKFYPATPGAVSVDIQFDVDSGVYYIIPVWNTDQFREQDPPKPYYWYNTDEKGGKG